VTRHTVTLIAFALGSLAATFLLPAVAQPAAYHDFADHRAVAGVANCSGATPSIWRAGSKTNKPRTSCG